MLRFLIILLIASKVILLHGQSEYNISVSNYNIEDGLSHNQIRWLHKDSRGMIWIGTANGINRYDGKSFRKVAELNFYSIKNRKILEDHEGDLWLKSKSKKNQLIFFNTRTERVKTFEEKFGKDAPFSKKSYLDAIMLADSTILIRTKTKNNELIRYSVNKEFSKVQVDINLVSGIWSIPDSEGFWLQSISQDTMMSTFNFFKKNLDGTYKRETAQDIPKGESLFGVTRDKELLFWKKEEKEHTYTFLDTQGKKKTFPFPYCISSSYFPSITYDAKHDRFLMLHDGQVSIMPRGDTTEVYTSNVYKDLIVKQVNFEFFKDDIYWIGGFYGLTELRVKSSLFKRTAYRNPDFFTRPEFSSVRFFHNYIDDLDPNWPPLIHRSDKNFWTYYKDDNGRVWAGGFRGISYLDPEDEKTQLLKIDTNIIKEPIGRAFQFFKNIEGQHWVVAENGLYQLDVEKGLTASIAVDESNHFSPSNGFRHIYQDKDSIYWIGTFQGLIRWDRKKNKHRLFTTKDGLSNNHIMAVYEDDYGFLWMSSDNGIMQFEKSTERIKVYLPGDGITHREFNRGAHFKDILGNLYFGSLNGITHFHPRDFVDFKEEQADIPLLLTECALFSEESKKQEDKMFAFLKNEKVIMQPGDKYLKLQFALLDYFNSNNVQYVYNIDGEIWNAGKENTLNISSLSYGAHTLIVKGKAGNGLFSKQELNISIEVLKPFYLQWWFLLSGGLILLLLALVVQKMRTRNLIKRQRELEETVDERTKIIQNQAEKLRELDKAKSRFLANISHEFRTPLTLILNTLKEEELKKLIAQGLYTEQINHSVRDLDVIQRNANRLQQLIDQLLDLSRLEVGKMTTTTEVADFQFYLNQIIQSFLPLAKKNAVQIKTSINLINPMLHFDRDKLDKIIYNLFSNAIRFTSEGGTIDFRVSQDSDGVLLRIKDSGIGIPSNQLPQIFDRFYQVNRDNDYSYEGTGLGLALVKELVEVHNGKIDVASQIDQGTTFKISLPLQVAQEQLQHEEPLLFQKESITNLAPIQKENFESQKNGKTSSTHLSPDKANLLVIEDNEDLLYYHQKSLSNEYNLLPANNGDLGIKMAFEHIPDVILCDVMMPGKNGFQVCEALKSDERTDHIPIVLLTAKAAHEDKLEGLALGAHSYLTKPFNQKELNLRLKNIAHQRLALQKQLRESLINTSPKPKRITAEEAFVIKCREIIEEQMTSRNFGVTELSNALHMGRTNTFRKIKAITGTTPTEFIRTYRLEKAKKLLLGHVGNGSEVSYMVGFSNPNYFFKCFKAEYDMTVSQFLEKETKQV